MSSKRTRRPQRSKRERFAPPPEVVNAQAVEHHASLVRIRPATAEQAVRSLFERYPDEAAHALQG